MLPREETKFSLPIGVCILGLVIGSLLPVLIFSTVLVVRSATDQQTLIARSVEAVATAASADLDRQIVRWQSLAQTMAESGIGEPRAFHIWAGRAMERERLSAALFDPAGHQLANTAVPFGIALPAGPDLVRHVVETGQPSVSDLVQEPGSDRFSVNITVPVRHDNELSWILRIRVSDGIAMTMSQHVISPDQTLGVTGRDGRIIYRTRDPEGSIGRQSIARFLENTGARDEGTYFTRSRAGQPVFVGFSRMKQTGWIVGVSIPTSVLFASARESQRRLLIFAASMLLFAVLIGWQIGRMVTRSMTGLSRLAGTLATLEPNQLRPGLVREVNSVSRSIVEAAVRLRRQSEQRVRDLKALSALESRFRQIVEGAPNAMLMVDRTGIVELVNAAAERLFGYGRGEIVGQPAEMLMPSPMRMKHQALRGAFLKNPRARMMGSGPDLHAVHKDGSEFPVEIGLNPIEMEDGTKVLAVVTDISDRKQKADQIQRAMLEKDLLLREIHHRVKNNLQIVSSLLDLQAGRVSDPEVLNMIRASRNRIFAMALIHQTLYGSDDFASVDFGVFLKTLIQMLTDTHRVRRDQIKVRLTLDAVLLPIDLAVPCGLIVNELITNCFVHAFVSRPAGEVSVELTHDESHPISLSVSDDGVGLPEDLDIRNTRSLGLRLVGLLADQIGGTISMNRSNPTVFRLTFPAASKPV